MKKLSILLLTILLTLTLTACNQDEIKTVDVNPAETYCETQAPTVAFSDFTINYEGAIKYAPENTENAKPTLVMYFAFSNNTEKALTPDKCIKISAKQGENNLKVHTYKAEYLSKELIATTKECKSKEVVTISYCFDFDEKGDDVTFELFDSNDKTKSKLTGKIEIKNLPLVGQTLNTEIATEISE